MTETPFTLDDEVITVADRWTYRWAARRRPFLHPVATPSGRVLTRDEPPSHPWHHGLWFTIKFVDDDNFWEEYDAYGVLRHDDPPRIVASPDGRVAVEGTLTWTRADRTTVALHERRTITHVPLGADAYALDLDTVLVPTTAVHLDRTPFTTWGGYGGLTFRGAEDLHDTRLLLDDGSTHERVLGTSSTWCDLSAETGPGGGPGDGAGIAILDHPSNRRHPVPFYASTRADTYGEGWSNFFNAAFLWHEGMDLDEGEELRIRHRAIIHDGVWDHDQVAAAWGDWVAETG